MYERSNVQVSLGMIIVWQYEVHRELPVSEVCVTTSYGDEHKHYLKWQPVYLLGRKDAERSGHGLPAGT